MTVSRPRSHLSVLMLLAANLLINVPDVVSGARWRSLSCPTVCPPDSDPVCGSDGIIYKNDCDMRRKKCNQDIEAVDLGNCSAHQGATCEHQCDKTSDLVCGTDGRTYINRCYQQVEYCERGIEFAHFGSCNNETVGKELCPLTCSGMPRDGPICASDGNVYSSSCEMKMTTCGQGVVPVDHRHCQTTKHCDSNCWKISRLTCGSDGKLYNNGCQMQRKNCGRHIFEMPVPFCLNKLYRTDCPSDCSDEPNRMVCGSDGHIYNNECEMKKLTCGFPLTRYNLITAVDFENCSSKWSLCSKMECPNDKKEVCGTDGNTYANLCHLGRVTCTAGVQLAHVGKCITNMTLVETCPDRCDEEAAVGAGGDQTSVKRSLICGSDGNMYRSECEMKQKTCGQNVVKADLSHCQATRFCDPNLQCPDKLDKALVCGSDNQFYPSECHMKKENCGRYVYVVPISQCLNNFKFVFSGCGKMCPKEYEPVCGTDDKTYSNQCFLEMANCRARSLQSGNVRRKYFGKCGEPKQKPRNYLYR